MEKSMRRRKEEVRKVLYISERIVNISELEKQIQNAKLYFDILKKRIKEYRTIRDNRWRSISD